MSYSKPIWHDVTACIYQGNKSYGAKETSESKVLVGSSAKNSHQLAHLITTRRFETHPDYGNICVFRFSVDGFVLKELIFENNQGKAGKLITKINLLDNDKQLKRA
jgi:hypothetical protein